MSGSGANVQNIMNNKMSINDQIKWYGVNKTACGFDWVWYDDINFCTVLCLYRRSGNFR